MGSHESFHSFTEHIDMERPPSVPRLPEVLEFRRRAWSIRGTPGLFPVVRPPNINAEVRTWLSSLVLIRDVPVQSIFLIFPNAKASGARR